MKLSDINGFEKINAQLSSLHEEISALSKKSQNDALNKFKLRFVNQAIQSAQLILGEAYRPFSDFEKFDDIDLPTNSDVTMMLGQYLNCMEKLRADNITFALGTGWVWKADGKETYIRTSPPQKLKE